METLLSLFGLLILAHLLADFPLQGDFLAKAKNPNTNMVGIPWRTALAAHCGIHAGLVLLVTGSWWCALAELVLHALIDNMKSNEVINFNQDQLFHVGCKMLYALAISTGVL